MKPTSITIHWNVRPWRRPRPVFVPHNYTNLDSCILPIFTCRFLIPNLWKHDGPYKRSRQIFLKMRSFPRIALIIGAILYVQYLSVKVRVDSKYSRVFIIIVDVTVNTSLSCKDLWCILLPKAIACARICSICTDILLSGVRCTPSVRLASSTSHWWIVSVFLNHRAWLKYDRDQSLRNPTTHIHSIHN